MSTPRFRRFSLQPAITVAAGVLCAGVLALSVPAAAAEESLPDRLTSANQTDTRDPNPKAESRSALTMPPIAEQRPLGAVGPDDILYEVGGESVTRRAWEDRARLASPYFATITGAFEVNYANLPPMNYVRSIEETVADEQGARKARELGITLDSEATKRLEAERKDVEYRLWLLKTGVARNIEPSQDDLKEYYNTHIDDYKESSQLTLKTIFVSTYQPYTVAEGETLAQLAERFPGVPDLGTQILSLTTRLPRAETIDKQPLVPGEELLVPVDAAQNAAAEARLREAYGKLQAGGAFDDVAKEYSTSANPTGMIIVRPEEDARPMNPAMVDQFMQLADGAVSAPFQTRHGWQVIKRLSYTPVTPKPIEKLSTGLYSTVRNERLGDNWQTYLAKLWDEQTMFKVEESALAQAHLPEARDMMLLAGPGFSLTAGQFHDRVGNRLTPSTTQAERFNLLRNIDEVQRALGEADSERLGITQDPLYLLAAQRLENKALTELYLDRRAEETVAPVPEAEIITQFEREKMGFNRTPSGEIWQLSIPLDFGEVTDPVERNKLSRQQVQKLAGLLADVDSLEKFTAKVAELSTDRYKDKNGRVGIMNTFSDNGLFARALDSKPQSLYGPVPQDGQLYAWWVGEKWPTSEVTLAEVRDRIAAALRGKAVAARRDDLRQELADQSGLRLHFNPTLEDAPQ